MPIFVYLFFPIDSQKYSVDATQFKFKKKGLALNNNAIRANTRVYMEPHPFILQVDFYGHT